MKTLLTLLGLSTLLNAQEIKVINYNPVSNPNANVRYMETNDVAWTDSGATLQIADEGYMIRNIGTGGLFHQNLWNNGATNGTPNTLRYTFINNGARLSTNPFPNMIITAQVIQDGVTNSYNIEQMIKDSGTKKQADIVLNNIGTNVNYAEAYLSIQPKKSYLTLTDKLNVTSPSGMNDNIYSSTNLVNWNVFTNYDSIVNNDNFNKDVTHSFNIDFDKPKEFYK